LVVAQQAPDPETRPLRVVSLVPSLTETVAASGLLVGVTDWCVEPSDLDVVRVGGTKNPRVDEVVALRPDLVLANEEENRAADLDALRAAGLRVHVTYVRSVPQALVVLAEVCGLVGLGVPSWLAAARAVWSGPVPPPVARAVVPIWHKPWMALGSDTFAGDLLARLGVVNVLGSATDRYPRFEPAELPPYDLVVLPDEPYAFAPGDEAAFAPVRAAFVSGRHLTWYGPSLAGGGVDLA
jgi:ABC-type Fe3+-hydroxamate transport system substrate-binding protein